MVKAVRPSAVAPRRTPKTDLLCEGIGLSEMAFLSNGGRESSPLMGTVALFIGSVVDIDEAKGSGEVVGDEDLVVWMVEGTVDDSALVRGKGNSSAGGIGRIFVAPSLTVGVGVMLGGLEVVKRDYICHGSGKMNMRVADVTVTSGGGWPWRFGHGEWSKPDVFCSALEQGRRGGS